MARSADWPIGVRSLDLRNPIQPIAGVERYSRVRIFVSDGGDLLGSADIRHGGAPDIPASRVCEAIVNGLGSAILARDVSRRLGADSAPGPLPPDVTVSIIVPTCDRPGDLRRCLASLAAQAAVRRIEILVVDNRPGGAATAAIVGQFPSVRLVAESRPGLSYARNTGIAHATGQIIVTTDDDVTAPPEWIERLVAPFARPEVMAVTGHVLPLELDTESQCRFEAYGGLGKGFARRDVDGRWFRSRRVAVPTWDLGATANAAFRAAVFRDPAIGLLDEALGAGMPAGCSEDTDLFYRILKADHTIVYEPSAWVWHRHRESMDGLRRQILGYSKGHVAYHLTTLLRDGDRRALVRLLYSMPRMYGRRIRERLRGRSEYPLPLILLEMRGSLAGPWALWQSRRRVARLGRSTPLQSRADAAGGARAGSPGEDEDAVPLEGPVAQSPSS